VRHEFSARNKLPAIYPFRYFVAAGGLISYGLYEVYRAAAGHVDRILRGEEPADLPVQAPTKYELIINLKTANALGLTVPQRLLTRADEVTSEGYDGVNVKPSSIQPVTPPIIIFTGKPSRERRNAALLAPLQCGPAQ
jgi:hypothetical protein